MPHDNTKPFGNQPVGESQTVMTVRLPTPLLRKLDRYARAGEMTRSNAIRMLIERCVPEIDPGSLPTSAFPEKEKSWDE